MSESVQSEPKKEGKGIPNFKKLQEKFQQSLSDKKAEFQNTEAKGFNFTNKVKGIDRAYLDDANDRIKRGNMPPRVDYIGIAKRVLTAQPKRQIEATKKWQAILVHSKMYLSTVRAREQKQEQEDAERVKLREELKVRVKNSKELTDNTQKLKEERDKKVQQMKKQWKQQAKQFKDWRAERLANVANQPLLLERPREKFKKE